MSNYSDWAFAFEFSMGRSINEELRLAVLKSELVKVRNLLTSGGDVNIVMKKNKNGLLHLATTPQVTETLLLHGASVNAIDIDGETALHYAITKKKDLAIVDILLKHGANIDMKNNFGLTPLHCAIMERSGLPMVRKLLQNGANVNATDNKRNSVLFLVVKYYKDHEIIMELLKFNADINVRSSSLNRFFTPVDQAIHDGDLSIAHLLIKVTVFKNYNKDFRKISDLRSYIRFSNNTKLSYFLDECAFEISRMKREKINMFSMFDYVKMDGDVKPLYLTNTTFDSSIINKYIIYQDNIVDSLRLCIQRANLLDKLKSLQISFEPTGINLKTAIKQDAFLNGDCLFKIGELLSNDDLLNFLIVIDKETNPSDYSVDRYLYCPWLDRY